MGRGGIAVFIGLLVIVSSIGSCHGTVGLQWQHVRMSHVPDCPLTEDFEMAISRPGCTHECHHFEAGKRMLYDKLEKGLDCPGAEKVSRAEINELYAEIIDSHVCKMNFSPVEGRHRMCISSSAVIMIVNKIAEICFPGSGSLVEPVATEGILKCDNRVTYPLRGTDGTAIWEDDEVEFDMDMENLGIDDPEGCIEDCDDEEKQKLYAHSKLMVEKLRKRYDFLQKRTDLLVQTVHLYEERAAKTTQPGIKNKLERKARRYRRRVVEQNRQAAQEILTEMLTYSSYALKLEMANPALTFTNLSAEPSVQVNLRKKDDRLQCVSKGSMCKAHYWRSNIRVNDECFNVCVSTLCDDDFTFMYCFKITVQRHLTIPECQSDMLQRNLCFSDGLGTIGGGGDYSG